MKWIAVVDPTRELEPGGSKMRRVVYDVLREMAAESGGVIVDIDEKHHATPLDWTNRRWLRARIEKARADGLIKTCSCVWKECERFHFSWLKERAYIVTDVRYAPRPKQRSKTNQDPIVAMHWEIVRNEFFDKMRGKL